MFSEIVNGVQLRKETIVHKYDEGIVSEYDVTIHALSDLIRKYDVISFDRLLLKIYEFTPKDSFLPQDIIDVLCEMKAIALSDDASYPILDWDDKKQKIYITDPFFIFYLIWGVKIVKENYHIYSS